MKKALIAVLAVGLIGGALIFVGSAYAQNPTPPAPGANGYGWGMMGGRGMMGGQYANGDFQSGWMHDDMVAALADQLGLSVDELNQQLADGKTMAQIAQDKGISAEDFYALMVEARQEALKNAVAEGDITQEQADWMNEHMQQMGAWGAGAGHCWGTDGSGAPGTRMGRGGRWGQSQTN